MKENDLSANRKAALHQRFPCNESFLFHIFDLFPIPIEVFNPDGFSAFVNGAFLKCFQIPDPSMIVGRLNVREDSFLLEKMNLSQHMEAIFSGEIKSLTDVRVPFFEIENRYHISRSQEGAQDIYQDITCFPLKDKQNAIHYVVALFLTRQVYKENRDVLEAKEYIKTHWRDEFNIDKIAGAAGFSRHYFARLFKKYTGMTPYCFYQEVIMKKLKEALQNQEYTVSQAFMSCGVDYHSSYAKLFKKRVGLTPLQYKNRVSAKKDTPSFPFQDGNGEIREKNPTFIFYRLEQITEIFEMFPFPINLFDTTGEVISVNQSTLELWNISDRSQIVGKYNVKNDPLVNERLGLCKYVNRAFAGELVLIPDVKVPLKDFSQWFSSRNQSSDIESMYTDILNFPILEGSEIRYIVSMFMMTRIYQGRTDIAKAREFMENNWRDNLDIDKIASVCGLSRYHFVRLFKKHTGITPYSYYQELKIQKLKVALRDKNRTVAEAFASCGIAYRGSWASLFREKVGMTPFEYRKSINNLK